MLLDRIVLPLQNLIECTPLSLKLVAIQPVVWKLVAESLEGLLAAGAQLDHRSPLFSLLLEVLDEGDEGDSRSRRRVGRHQQL